MENLNKYLKVAKQAALTAGQITVKGFLDFDRAGARQKKRYRELFTKYDLASESAIRKIILKHFPEHGINGEEKGLKGKGDYIWQVDPIDGTTNFIIHNPLFAVSVALQYKKETIVGAIYIPILKEMFWTVKGKGAWLNNKKLHVSKQSMMKDAILSVSFGHNNKYNINTLKWQKELKLSGHKVRILGSACVSMAWVAAGRMEATIMSQMGPWDFATAELLVKEAGGQITNHKGNRVSSLNVPVVLSNRLLHKKLLAKLT